MTFTSDQDYKRLDLCISKNVSGLSRSFISALCDQGKVKLNSNVTYKTSVKVNAGAVIDIDYDFDKKIDIPEIDLEILYRDDDCLIVVKPEGLLTHSKGQFNPEPTVSSFIRQFTTGMQDNRGGIVHRLDRVTSGLLICAKNQKAIDWLQKQFADRKVKKTYLAVVAGIPEQAEAMIDMPIERNPKKPQTFRVGPNGKPAKTHYIVKKSNATHSLIELHPETGRTHQLRVHLAQIGHPIVGDVLYGGEPADRTYLHALELELRLPNRERQKFTAQAPESFNELVN